MQNFYYVILKKFILINLLIIPWVEAVSMGNGLLIVLLIVYTTTSGKMVLALRLP